MKYSVVYLLFICIQLTALAVSGQDLKAHFDSTYHKDPALYNGMVFSNIYDRSVLGTQFYEENNFNKNKLGVSDKIFKDQYINYDVYNQKLLLTYLDENNAQKMVEIPIENVQFFTIADHYFESIKDLNNEYKYYEVFPFKENKILLYWSKYMKNNSNNAYYPYRFSSIKRQVSLYFDNEIFKIQKNKDFISYFPLDQQDKLRSWLKTSKIKIHKASISQMKELANFLEESE